MPVTGNQQAHIPFQCHNKRFPWQQRRYYSAEGSITQHWGLWECKCVCRHQRKRQTVKAWVSLCVCVCQRDIMGVNVETWCFAEAPNREHRSIKRENRQRWILKRTNITSLRLLKNIKAAYSVTFISALNVICMLSM